MERESIDIRQTINDDVNLGVDFEFPFNSKRRAQEENRSMSPFRLRTMRATSPEDFSRLNLCSFAMA
jgi:hypothetical protein